MKIALIGILLLGSVSLGAADMDVKEEKWDLKNHAVDNLSMIPPVEDDGKFAPAAMLFDLTGKKKTVAVSLCGPALLVESGADLPDEALGSLSVEKMDGVGWFGSVSQVVDGKVILRVNTSGEMDLIEKEIKEFQEKHSCSYL